VKETSLNRNLLVLCYPLDWHWVLSYEFLNHENKLGVSYDVLNLSYVGETGTRKLIKNIVDGSKLQRTILKNWKVKEIVVSKHRDNWPWYNFRMNFRAIKLRVVNLESAREAFNTIVERAGNLKPNTNSNSKIIRQEIIAREKIRSALSSVDLGSYETVVTVNGRFTKNAVVLSWAKGSDVPTKLIEFGSSATKFEVYKSSPQSMEEIESKINEYWNSADEVVREFEAKSYLNRIIKNCGLSEVDWRNSMKPGEAPKKGTKKICTFFSSTELEYIGVGDEIPKENFQNQVAAFKALVDLLDKEDWNIYLRMHPNNPGNKIQGAESFIWDEFKDFSHIKIISSDSSVDSLALGGVSDLIASFGSNIAMEFVARGISNVLTLGPAPWNKLLPKLYKPDLNSLSNYFMCGSEEINISSIYPWAYFVSTFGTDFDLVKFNAKKSKWSF
jgi:hypothetical protein